MTTCLLEEENQTQIWGLGLPAAEAGVSAYGLLVLHSLQTSPLISSFLLLSFTPLTLFQYSPLLHAHRKPVAVSR